MEQPRLLHLHGPRDPSSVARSKGDDEAVLRWSPQLEILLCSEDELNVELHEELAQPGKETGTVLGRLDVGQGEIVC